MVLTDDERGLSRIEMRSVLEQRHSDLIRNATQITLGATLLSDAMAPSHPRHADLLLAFNGTPEAEKVIENAIARARKQAVAAQHLRAQINCVEDEWGHQDILRSLLVHLGYKPDDALLPLAEEKT